MQIFRKGVPRPCRACGMPIGRMRHPEDNACSDKCAIEVLIKDFGTEWPTEGRLTFVTIGEA